MHECVHSNGPLETAEPAVEQAHTYDRAGNPPTRHGAAADCSEISLLWPQLELAAEASGHAQCRAEKHGAFFSRYLSLHARM